MDIDKKIEVVIPVYKPKDKKDFRHLICLLLDQTIKPSKIHIMATLDDDVFKDVQSPEDFKEWYDLQGIDELNVHYLKKSEFDHGATRNLGASYAKDADYIFFMTQDAIPVDDKLIENLLASFENKNLAIAYARQLPREDATKAEKYSRNFNYPDKSIIKSKDDIDKLGIKTFFCSNVAALYDKKIFDKQAGFASPIIFNEDMVYAAGVIKEGYDIAYCAKARVLHSHNYSATMQLHRNFDLGVSQADHPEVFENIKSESEGIKYAIATIKYLVKEKAFLEIPTFVTSCAFRLYGYKKGKNYKKMKMKNILKLTMNRDYWKDY